MIFQSTLPTRGSDVIRRTRWVAEQLISIHAPHEGERPEGRLYAEGKLAISIHAPHEGERP